MAEYNYKGDRVNNGEANHLIKEGQYLLKGKNYQDVLRTFELAKVLNDSDARVYIGMGDCLYQLCKYEDACEAYDKAISYDKKRARAYIRRACSKRYKSLTVLPVKS